MPTIYPNLVPNIEPGNLFSKLVNDNSLSIRWITKLDPVMFEVANRPVADMAVRQLIIAKAVDQINLRLGHQAYFPFVVQPQIISGTAAVNIPLSWIWDMNATLPEKWVNLRLAKIKRISGTNIVGTGDEYNGILRLFFTATAGGTTEYYTFYVDYDIASVLAYQATEIVVVTDEEVPAVNPAEFNTIAGQLTFRTLDIDDADIRSFLDSVPPPADLTDSNGDGFYDNPSSYDVVDDVAGVINSSPISHGSGLLTDSGYNRLPDLGANVNSWVEAFNYPFRVSADRQSFTIVGGEAVTIPSTMFSEFSMTTPAGDNDITDYSSSPVWVNRIKLGQVNNIDPNYITFYFATYNILDNNTSVAPVEFGTLTLFINNNPGDILPIKPVNNLLGQTGVNADLFNQQFGRGHVVLSSKWGGTEILNFFNQFPLIVGSDQIEFTQTSSTLSSFSLNRSPKYGPTKGQSQALMGTSARFDEPVFPSDSNRYVTEADQGRGDRIDLHAAINPITSSPIEPNPDIEQYGYEGSLVTKEISLIVNASGTEHTYETDILPRLRCLFGREFVHGDAWMDGTRWKKWDSFSNSWVG